MLLVRPRRRGSLNAPVSRLTKTPSIRIGSTVELFNGIIWLVIMFGIVYVLRTLTKKGTAAIRDAATGNSLQRSQEAVHRTLVIRAPVSSSEYVRRLQQSLSAEPALSTGYRVEADPSGEMLTVSKWGLGMPSMRFGVSVTDDGSACIGRAWAVSWRESEGRTDSVKGIETIHQCIRALTVSLGGDVGETISPSNH